MKMVVVSLMSLLFLDARGAFAIDYLGVEMASGAIAGSLEKAEEVPDKCIHDLFYFLKPWDQFEKENIFLRDENQDRESLVKDWEGFLISITEEGREYVIQNFAEKILSLAIEDNVSNKILERGFEVITQQYNKSLFFNFK